MLHKKNQQVYKKKHSSWAYSWTWRHNVALLESVAAALPKALEHWSFEKRKKWMGGCLPGMIENHNFLMFLFLTLEEQNRFTAQAKRKFWHLSHTPANRHECPHCKHFLTSRQIQAFCLSASKIRISKSSPLQGRRVNRLPSFSVWIVCWGCCGWLGCWLDWFITKKLCWMFQPCILCHLLLTLCIRWQVFKWFLGTGWLLDFLGLGLGCNVSTLTSVLHTNIGLTVFW